MKIGSKWISGRRFPMEKIKSLLSVVTILVSLISSLSFAGCNPVSMAGQSENLNTPTTTQANKTEITEEVEQGPNPFLIEITDGFGISMVLVPAGEFTMGGSADAAQAECQKFYSECEREWLTNEEPPHRVYLDPFFIDKYEVTNAAYQACVEAGECSQPTNTDHYDDPEYTNHPVVYVDWDQAKTYCEWRDGDLPTEAQWEKAARGTDERTYPWGEGIDCSKANYIYSMQSESCVGDTTEVGSYESGVSPYGLYDMAGNVLEWTADWYDSSYYGTLADGVWNPTGPASGEYRVQRGGAWSFPEVYQRASLRAWDDPYSEYFFVGFRCLRGIYP
jgi:formylglycine-generating enzyme required for sulfatase activity